MVSIFRLEVRTLNHIIQFIQIFMEDMYQIKIMLFISKGNLSTKLGKLWESINDKEGKQ